MYRSGIQQISLCSLEKIIHFVKESEIQAENERMWEEVCESLDNENNNEDISDDPAEMREHKNGMSRDICYRRDIQYRSSRPRTCLACPSDDKALLEVLKGIMSAKLESGSERNSVKFCARDSSIFCSSCVIEYDLTLVRETVRREVLLHTIHQGTVEILIIDSLCSRCMSIVPYDGA